MNIFLAGLRYVEDNLLKRFTMADVARAAGYSANHYCRLFHLLTGKPFDVVVKDTLFDPLGIADVEWIRFPGGQPVAGWGLRLRPRDLAKIGQLVLAKGAWQGKRIVSAAWIEQATALHMNGEGLYFYGYKFWLGRSLVAGRTIDWAAGVGWRGQRMFVVPSEDLVVVILAGLYDTMIQSIVGAAVLNRHVLPAIVKP